MMHSYNSIYLPIYLWLPGSIMFSNVLKLPISSAQKPLVRFDIVGMLIIFSYISIELLVPSESIAVFFYIRPYV
jgi:hypothetical protein